jgi:hypothetical protein
VVYVYFPEKRTTGGLMFNECGRFREILKTTEKAQLRRKGMTGSLREREREEREKREGAAERRRGGGQRRSKPG